ncbi:MAG: hypothetical protein EOM83_15185, partial [Clostridia bacterium]|nr:hypothetical protein [Clostridia bacterium]
MKNIQIILFILFSSLAGIAQNPIVDFEYYVDEDPGYNLATPIPIAPGLLHELDFTIPTSGLSKGFHVAGMRGRDDRNNWSHDFIQFFYVDLLQHEDDPITQVEYFIDNDPGIGNATPVSITPGKVVDLAFNLDVSMLEPGFHFLSVRSASENNIWSHAYTHMFLMDVLDGGESPITRVEYF